MTTELTVFQSLSKVGVTARTEADIQSDIKLLLLSGDFDLESPRLEEQVGDGTKRRIDIAAGATVIEVKKRLTSLEADQTYIDQLQGYVETRMAQNNSRYNGILTDGRTWWLFEDDPKSGEFSRRSEFVLTSADKGHALQEWLQAVLATRQNIRPIQSAIETYLGANSPAYRQDMAYLGSLYESLSSNPTVELKRQLWATLLRSALGTDFKNQTHLFIDHTLLVIEASIIGHAVMGLALEELVAHPEQLLDGEEFRQAGIHNVIEPGFFDWVLAAGTDGRRFLSHLVKRISMFEWSEIDHDVLKILYESIINAETRKSMGEYYTPDWLAEGVVENVLDRPLEQSALDPACGSGTFVFQAIRHVIRAANEADWSAKKTIDHIQRHIFGLDIHPVSVTLARVTYLLALGDLLLDEDRNSIWVPVYLGDSMQWYQPGDHEEAIVKVDTNAIDLATPGTQEETLFDIGQTLAFPLGSISDTDDFDRLVTEMTNRAKEHTDSTKKRPSVHPILKRFGINKTSDDYAILSSTFDLLCDLNAEGRDSIWGFYVRNQARPLWLSMPGRRVDVLIGNPPWLSYRFMTEDMQKKFESFSKRDGLWEGAEVANQQDLVALFIVRSVTKYLDKDGKFGFVTPLAVLSRKAYYRFRSGKWGRFVRGDVTELWDLDDVRPRGFFPVPAAVVFGTKHEVALDGRYDVEPSHGFPHQKTAWKGVRDKRGWKETHKQLTAQQVSNISIGNEDVPRSPYNSIVTNGATIFPKFLFFVNEEKSTSSKLGKKAGTVSVSSLRGKNDKEPWKSLPGLSGVVPTRYIFNVYLGSTLTPYRTLTPSRALLPIQNDTVLDEAHIDLSDNRLRTWWNEASKLWEANKTAKTKLSLWQNLNFQNKLSRQLGSTKYRVIYPLSGNTLAAAVLDDPRAIVEQTLLWIPTSGIEEARYLTAILNAPVTTKMVSVYQSRGLFGARHFTKDVWRLPIPKFNPEDTRHQELVALAMRAEEVAEAVEIDGYGFQKARKLIRNALDTKGATLKINELVTELLN